MWKHVVLAAVIISFSRCIEKKEKNDEGKDNSTKTEQVNFENKVTGNELKYIKKKLEYYNNTGNISESKNIDDLNADEDNKSEDVPTNDTIAETTRSWVPFNNDVTINITDTVKDKKTVELQDVCLKFINLYSKFNLNEMVDVWQTLYHQMSEKVPCFKIYIRRTTSGERIKNTKKYGTFNDTVDWDRCYLEIRASTPMTRRHFLEGNDSDEGVLENIIIDKVIEDGSTQYTLIDEVGDQWSVNKNILLMRDCETGGVVAFSRVPHEPSLQEIKEALVEFGEESMNGSITCANNQYLDKKSAEFEDD